MEAKLNELVVISRSNLNALIEAAGGEVLNNTDIIEATTLANYAYEAGKLDKELSLTFDYPKNRFLNSNINF